MRVSILILGLIILTFSLSAQAQETYQCGVPSTPGLEKTDDPEFWRYCDYHTRRFDYIREQKEFRRMLDERRENYVRYRETAINNYKDQLEGYYDSIQ